ncbi:MAG: SMP-30/gluconolactonase/LRE family protein [Candidatus Schekmanbacteria bacterium]|nr:SMP-30/gluconolactonase/LRE family protein [Candidatus Schekmanbacteria bacterium]
MHRQESIKERSRVTDLAFGATAVLLALTAMGCPSTQQAPPKAAIDLVWPLPPEQPRIRYVGSLASGEDVGKDKGAAAKLSEKLLGVQSSDMAVLAKPYAVASDRGERVYVADSALGTVIVFDYDKKDVRILGQEGAGQLGKAMGVCVDSQGNVYVSDSSSRRVVVFDRDGKYLRALGGTEILYRPIGVALDEGRKLLYVADSGAHQVAVLELETGELVRRIGRDENPAQVPTGAADYAWNRGGNDGEFRFPTSLAVDGQGRVHVMDTMNFRVQIFSPEGKFLRSIGQNGKSLGTFARPKGVAVDSAGNVYAVDAAFNNVQIFSADGQLLMFFGSIGTKKGEFWLPAGICIDKTDKIFVVDQYNKRIQIFQPLNQEVDNANKMGSVVSSTNQSPAYVDTGNKNRS